MSQATPYRGQIPRCRGWGTDRSGPNRAGRQKRLRNRRRWREALELAPATQYHDLSSDPAFMELYQRALFLPHTDEERYRAALAGTEATT